MSATIIDGKLVAEKIKSEIKKILEEEFLPKNLKPGLAAILVGDDPASQIYVRSKSKTCQALGFKSQIFNLNRNTSESELIELIDRLNADDTFHGILVQQPLPKHIRQDFVNEAISPTKDVDGFHPLNFGKLLMGEDTLRPCTPAGIQELLIHYQIPTEGKHVVIVGRSNIVGKPLLAILIQKEKYANATVTLCHSATKDLKDYTLSADILISAMGKPSFIKAEMVNENSVIIDVGINRINDINSEKGYKVVGDVDFDEVSKKVKFITPVPGGVGPMTIAMLMKNTLIASAKFFNIRLND